MNKKSIYLVVAGFMMILFQFQLKFGTVIIDVFHDSVGYILVFMGALDLAPLNKLFGKVKKHAIMGFVASLFVQLLNTMDFSEYYNTVLTFKTGITAFFFIYATYYFTEAVILEAKNMHNVAPTKNFQIAWLVFAGTYFLYFLALMSGVSGLSMIVMIITYITGLYHTITVVNATKMLCPEEE